MTKSILLGTALAFAGLSLGACANLHPPSFRDEIKPGTTSWVSYDASRRGAWVAVDSSGNIRSCAEPVPDVAMSFVNQLKGDFTLPNDASASEVEATMKATAAALAGRDNLVLLARESLFRICEASANGVIDGDQAHGLMKDTLDLVVQIAKTQAAEADARSAVARNSTLMDFIAGIRETQPNEHGSERRQVQ